RCPARRVPGVPVVQRRARARVHGRRRESRPRRRARLRRAGEPDRAGPGRRRRRVRRRGAVGRRPGAVVQDAGAPRVPLRTVASPLPVRRHAGVAARRPRLDRGQPARHVEPCPVQGALMAGALTVKEAESVGAVAPAEARPRALEVVLAAVAALCGLGLVMAVSVQGPERGVLLAIKAQGGKLAVATIGFLAFALVPLRLLRRFATPAFLVCVALCLIAALFGREVNNARRWLPWGGQPVEFARFALIVFCAAAVQRAGPEIVTFRRGMLPLLGAGTLLAGVLALQPDMGNAFLALLTSAAIALVAGVRLRWFAVLGVPALVAFAFAALQLDYVRNRLAGFFAGTPSFQVQQS